MSHHNTRSGKRILAAVAAISALCLVCLLSGCGTDKGAADAILAAYPGLKADITVDGKNITLKDVLFSPKADKGAPEEAGKVTIKEVLLSNVDPDAIAAGNMDSIETLTATGVQIDSNEIQASFDEYVMEAKKGNIHKYLQVLLSGSSDMLKKMADISIDRNYIKNYTITPPQDPALTIVIGEMESTENLGLRSGPGFFKDISITYNGMQLFTVKRGSIKSMDMTAFADWAEKLEQGPAAFQNMAPLNTDNPISVDGLFVEGLKFDFLGMSFGLNTLSLTMNKGSQADFNVKTGFEGLTFSPMLLQQLTGENIKQYYQKNISLAGVFNVEAKKLAEDREGYELSLHNVVLDEPNLFRVSLKDAVGYTNGSYNFAYQKGTVTIENKGLSDILLAFEQKRKGVSREEAIASLQRATNEDKAKAAHPGLREFLENFNRLLTEKGTVKVTFTADEPISKFVGPGTANAQFEMKSSFENTPSPAFDLSKELGGE